MKNFWKSFFDKIRKILNKNLNKILEIFFVEECLFCKDIGETICKNCLDKIKKYPLKNNLNLNWIEAAFNYENEILKNALFSLKYNHNKSVAKYLGEISAEKFYKLLKEKVKEKIESPNVLIIPIPISKKRMRERNYNQSQEIAKEILKNIFEKDNIDLRKNLIINFLIKNKNTVKFSHTHDQNERQDLIKDVFEINPRSLRESPLIDGTKTQNTKIILIDDIATTGATFYEARKTLIDFGFQKENIFAFAVAH